MQVFLFSFLTLPQLGFLIERSSLSFLPSPSDLSGRSEVLISLVTFNDWFSFVCLFAHTLGDSYTRTYMHCYIPFFFWEKHCYILVYIHAHICIDVCGYGCGLVLWNITIHLDLDWRERCHLFSLVFFVRITFLDLAIFIII